MDYRISDTCQIPVLNDIYNRYFGERISSKKRLKGFFVDVGAADGISYSNTSGLAELGWGGLMIEPLKRDYLKCKERYSEFQNIQVIDRAISNWVGEGGRLYTGNIPHVCSTMNKEFRDLISQTDYGKDFYNKLELVRVNTLDNILKSYLTLFPENIYFNVLSIDVEGSELEVLDRFNIGFYSPTLVIIEAHELHQGDDRPIIYPEINEYFKKHKYEKIYCDEINNIYVRKPNEVWICRECGWRGSELEVEYFPDYESPYENHEVCPICSTYPDNPIFLDWEKYETKNKNQERE